MDVPQHSTRRFPPAHPLASCLAIALLMAHPVSAATHAESVHAVKSGAGHVGFRRGFAGAYRPGASHAHDVLMRREPPSRPSTTRPVTTCADDGSAGSLRVVVASAVSGDLVDMSSLACGTITLTGGEIGIDVDDLTLQGPGQSALTIDGGNTSRIFSIFSNGTVAMYDFSMAHGFVGQAAFAVGGCVYSYFANPNSLLVLARVTVSECTAGDSMASYAGGGGVLTYGAISVEASTISGNHVTGGVGASYVAGGIGTLYNATIVGSLVTGNTAIGTSPGTGVGFGAGLDLSGTPGTGGSVVSSSTISGNTAGSTAGGVYFFTPYLEPVALTATVSNSTISGNAAANDAGLEVRLASVTLDLGNTTIAFNAAAEGCGGLSVAGTANDLQSSIVANNVGAGGEDDVCGAGALGGANNLILVSTLALPGGTIVADPMLGPLQDNGGPTSTHALLAGSPAIDNGNDTAALDFDQRGNGFPRIAGAGADIGAFEVQGGNDRIFANGFDP